MSSRSGAGAAAAGIPSQDGPGPGGSGSRGHAAQRQGQSWHGDPGSATAPACVRARDRPCLFQGCHRGRFRGRPEAVTQRLGPGPEAAQTQTGSGWRLDSRRPGDSLPCGLGRLPAARATEALAGPGLQVQETPRTGSASNAESWPRSPGVAFVSPTPARPHVASRCPCVAPGPSRFHCGLLRGEQCERRAGASVTLSVPHVDNGSKRDTFWAGGSGKGAQGLLHPRLTSGDGPGLGEQPHPSPCPPQSTFVSIAPVWLPGTGVCGQERAVGGRVPPGLDHRSAWQGPGAWGWQGEGATLSHRARPVSEQGETTQRDTGHRLLPLQLCAQRSWRRRRPRRPTGPVTVGGRPASDRMAWGPPGKPPGLASVPTRRRLPRLLRCRLPGRPAPDESGQAAVGHGVPGRGPGRF
nr:spidroin-2-like isoform X2 [Microcebus murinus]